MDQVQAQVREIEKMLAKRQAQETSKDVERREKHRREQVEAGKCNVVPHPKVATQPFRSELTLEQNSLFVANRFKSDHFIRESTVSHPETKEPVLRRVMVGKTDPEERSWGVLKQVHQDVFYRVLQLWAKHGYPVGTIDGKTYGSFTASAYELVRAIRGDDSRRHYRRARALLQELANIPVVLQNVYTWQGLQDRLQFTLLGDVIWNDKGVDKKTCRPKLEGTSEVTVLLSPMVTESFLHAHVKTLLGEPYRALGAPKRGGRGELARLLYPFLDAQLATKKSYHSKLSSLVARFGLSDPGKKSHRKRQFSSAVRVLDGKLILREQYCLRVTLEESSDGEDYVLVAKRGTGNQLPLFRD